MSNEQGFSKLPNDVLDVLMAELSGNTFKVYMAIFRKTAGFNKASDNIPMSQLHKLTGIKDKHTVIDAINDLEVRKLISVTRQTGRVNTYAVCSHQCEKSTPVQDNNTSVKTPHVPVGKNHTATSGENPHPSKDNTKDNIQKTNSLGGKPQKQPVQRTAKPTPKDEKAKSYTVQDLVDLGCDAQCAKDWLAIRTKKLTESALNRNISQASKVGLTLAEAVAWCAENAWQGFTANWYLNATKQPIATFSQKPASRSDGWDELFNQGDSDIRDVTPPKKYPPIEEVFHA